MPKPQPSSKPSKKIAPAPPVQPPKPPSKRDMKTISFADILKAKGVPEDVLKPRDIGPMILDAVKDGHAKVLITGLGTFYVGEVKGRTIVTPVGTPDGVPREIMVMCKSVNGDSEIISPPQRLLIGYDTTQPQITSAAA